MLAILTVISILAIYDLQKFIREKEPKKIFVIYLFFTTASLVVGMLLAAGRRPAGPAEWIEGILKMIGVLK